MAQSKHRNHNTRKQFLKLKTDEQPWIAHWKNTSYTRKINLGWLTLRQSEMKLWNFKAKENKILQTFRLKNKQTTTTKNTCLLGRKCVRSALACWQPCFPPEGSIAVYTREESWAQNVAFGEHGLPWWRLRRGPLCAGGLLPGAVTESSSRETGQHSPMPRWGPEGSRKGRDPLPGRRKAVWRMAFFSKLFILEKF